MSKPIKLNWTPAREALTKVKSHQVKGLAWSVMAGLRLLALHDALGVKAGRKTLNSAQSSEENGKELYHDVTIKWGDLVKEHLNISRMTAHRYMEQAAFLRDYDAELDGLLKSNAPEEKVLAWLVEKTAGMTANDLREKIQLLALPDVEDGETGPETNTASASLGGTTSGSKGQPTKHNAHLENLTTDKWEQLFLDFDAESKTNSLLRLPPEKAGLCLTKTVGALSQAISNDVLPHLPPGDLDSLITQLRDTAARAEQEQRRRKTGGAIRTTTASSVDAVEMD